MGPPSLLKAIMGPLPSPEVAVGPLPSPEVTMGLQLLPEVSVSPLPLPEASMGPSSLPEVSVGPSSLPEATAVATPLSGASTGATPPSGASMGATPHSEVAEGPPSLPGAVEGPLLSLEVIEGPLLLPEVIMDPSSSSGSPRVIVHRWGFPLASHLRHLVASQVGSFILLVSSLARHLAPLVLGLSYGAIQRPDYDDTPNPEFLNPFWMASIPDDRWLSEVTMPGTHNTMAFYGGVYSECQTWSLASQLRAGVRFLDIRVRHVNGNLTIHHGVSYQWAHFGHVLEGVADFLHEYPTETVLMRLKEEFSETNNIYDAVVDFIHRYAHWDLLWDSRLMPTMGEARGKLIIMQNFQGPDLGMSYNSMDIADDWKVPTLSHVEDKWQSVYKHLEAAPTGNKYQIFLTFTSGAGVLAHPRAVAQHVNPLLYDYLMAKMTDLNQRFGIICMDFPAAPLIQMIIDFQPKEERQAFNPKVLH
ncbi:1-phosphatidylinositol phosphodiesterase [Pholidichthys leucotaenia]